jgi:hypothetical protein
MDRLIPAPLQISDLPRGRMNVRQVRVRQLVRNWVSRGHEGKVNLGDGWAYRVMVRLTSWIPSLVMYLAVRMPVPQMT